MGRLIVASMAKNEADKYWTSALAAWNRFADEIVVLDDGSTDDTRKIAEEAGANVFFLPDTRDAWGAESSHRAALFAYAWRRAEEGDVILWLDADMAPANDPTDFLWQPEYDQFAFVLYDLWRRSRMGTLQYRSDSFWRAHITPRIWAIRKQDEFEVRWDVRGIHSGHIPASWFLQPRRTLTLPPSHGILHYGYFTPEDRQEHFERYMMVKRLLTQQELEHAKTIIDEKPNLVGLTVRPEFELERAT